jgi:ADP-dependent NAD(P)H-hydrate dehydratase / NAD(P)H-hydrate epimerase
MQNIDLRLDRLEQVVVTAAQMSQIEGRMFEAGMPVAALMEKVAGLIARRAIALYPKASRVGVLVGPGHNGGDALVVARELSLRGYDVRIYRPLHKSKMLTEQHARYVGSLGIPFTESVDLLLGCDVLIDGLFGFGLERPIDGELAAAIDRLNRSNIPIISIDLPSGLHADTGEVLGTAICATHTLCLGLWKLACLQERALSYLGKVERVDFDIPWDDVQAIAGKSPQFQRITPKMVRSALPLTRSLTTHKYQQGHLLLVCGSRRYTGAALLAGLGARASGVGMVSVAVPASLKLWLSAQLPEALVIGCPETPAGAIAALPSEVDLARYSAVVCGPGLTEGAIDAVQAVWGAPCPLVLDADGLNSLAQMGSILPKEPPLIRGSQNGIRSHLTVFTPHWGEFQRMFPQFSHTANLPIAARSAAQHSGAIVVLKGAKTAIAHPHGMVWLNPESTPALARGGTGDVLVGLMGGSIAQAAAMRLPLEPIVPATVWWHAQAGIRAARDRTELGVDALTLTQYLSLQQILDG